MQLPDISGLEVCSAARRVTGSRRPLFIIVMSSTEDFGLVFVKALLTTAPMTSSPSRGWSRNSCCPPARRGSPYQHAVRTHQICNYRPAGGLLTGGHFLKTRAEACGSANRDSPISTILFDIDHFKNINDGYGHEAGDIVLATVGTAAKMVANGSVGRLGGEEFCVLEHCDLGDAVELAEALRNSIKNLSPPPGSRQCHLQLRGRRSGNRVTRSIVPCGAPTSPCTRQRALGAIASLRRINLHSRICATDGVIIGAAKRAAG